MKHLSRSSRFIILFLALLVIAGSLFAAGSHSASAAPDAARRSITIAAAQPDIAAALKHFPQWSAAAEEEDAEQHIWDVTFYEDQQQEEWLGDAQVDLDDEAVLEYDIPIFLSREEEARQKAEVEAFTLADAQVLALLGNPDDWESYADYDPYEAAWSVTFEHGLDAWQAVLQKDEEGRWLIDHIQDPYAFSEEEKQHLDRDKAIELAGESDALWQALENVDDWQALASPLTDHRWNVSFVAADKEIYAVVVDIDAWKIIEENADRAEKSSHLP